jgi:hypothetical protein
MTYSASFASRSRLSSLKLATSARSARISSTCHGHQRSSGGHQEASALAHSGRARATCSTVPNYLPNYLSHAGRASATYTMVPFFFSIGNQWQSVAISGHQCQSPVPRVAWSPSYSQTWSGAAAPRASCSGPGARPKRRRAGRSLCRPPSGRMHARGRAP